MEHGNKRKRSFFRRRIRPTLKPKSPQKTFNNPTQKKFQMEKSYDKQKTNPADFFNWMKKILAGMI